jgi:hypothetical protein
MQCLSLFGPQATGKRLWWGTGLIDNSCYSNVVDSDFASLGGGRRISPIKVSKYMWEREL